MGLWCRKGLKDRSHHSYDSRLTETIQGQDGFEASSFSSRNRAAPRQKATPSAGSNAASYYFLRQVCQNPRDDPRMARDTMASGEEAMTTNALGGPFTVEEVVGFLSDHGYSTDPNGMTPLIWPDCEFAEGIYWFDVHADAVRRENSEVPDRPIRVTFHKLLVQGYARLEMASVKELAPGVKSKAFDRQPGTPKMNAPWPI